MLNDSDKIAKLWKSQYSPYILKYSQYEVTEQFQKFAAVFAPGESYFYILNMHNLELDYISPGVTQFMNTSPENVSMEQLLKAALPEEIEKLEKKEMVIKDFFTRYLKPSELLDYKIIYSYKMTDYKGKKRLMLMQATPLSVTESNTPLHVLTIHSDISHLAKISTGKVSFMHLKGGKSFFNVPTDRETFNPKAGNSEPDISSALTSREKEIIDLLAKGYGAKQIADCLNLSIHTIHTHRKNVLAKSGCKNTAELIAESMMAGILQ
ncbi:LuxR C-terminal-related transcriptional regulator [Autumnicola musiva]|uniref:LuxR C-terminal-related transcriptional regulator n=1 Tax=Autumnicola musiva TaxID=3075589 RepID=A0ABU3D912_9FLAO|nr:LuxR C-terminal-related transcriptional regulator [Zunongwangia sp. F117]MDT0678016.1 LuxR C-terminal-related transcriptional regulator [Zunongwangia sp. F117]